MDSCESIPPNYIWIDDYLVNIHKIDEQHRGLFTTAGKLYKMFLGHEDIKEMDHIFSSLIRQTIVHFRTEEEFMQSHHYPEYEHHKKLHDLLIQQIEDMQDSQQVLKSLHFQQPWIEKVEVADYLSGWLINHIIDEDKKLGTFLRDSGME